MKLSIEDLKEALDYNPDTGWFIWKITTHGYGGMINPGDRAGTVSRDKSGYTKRRQITIWGRMYRESRLAWAFMEGEWLPSEFDVDHINGDATDNRWSNLRKATRSQNNHNNHNYRSDNVSGYPGVSLKTHRSGRTCWHARVIVNGKVILLGDYADKEDAIVARRAAELKYFGEFAPQRTGT